MNRGYEDNERILTMRQIREIEQRPLQERQEARAEYLKDMATNPELIGERVNWLLNGSYGYGSYVVAWDVVHGRGNKTAGLALLVASLEWGCPNNFARDAWKKLTPEQQAQVTAVINTEIVYAVKEREEGAVTI